MHPLIVQITRLPANRIILWLELFAVGLALSLYMYYIVTSVIEIVLREELSVAIKAEKTNISELEATYFSMLNELSPERADEFNLVAAVPSSYVHVVPGTDRLTLRE